MSSRGGAGRNARHSAGAEPRDPMKIPVRKWHKDDFRVAHFTIKRWVPVDQEYPTPEIQQAGRLPAPGKRKSGSSKATDQSQGGGRFTRKKKEEMAAGGEYMEELISGLEAVPMLARDYQRAAQQEMEIAVQEPDVAQEVQSNDFPYEPVDAGLTGLDFLESSNNWAEFNPQQGQSNLFPYLG